MTETESGIAGGTGLDMPVHAAGGRSICMACVIVMAFGQQINQVAARMVLLWWLFAAKGWLTWCGGAPARR